MSTTARSLKEPDVTWDVSETQGKVALRVHTFNEPDGDDSSSGSSTVDIPRELRDNVAQQLTTISSHLEKVGCPSRAGELQCIEEQLLRVIRDVRCLSHGGTSMPVSAREFPHAIRTLVQMIRASTPLHTILVLHEAPTLTDAVAESLYRITQEAVHNVIRHARATRLRVEFRAEQQRLVLAIRDNGIGTTTEERSTGKGFESMACRASAIGATLDVRSVPGGGTAVRCIVPTE